ACEGVEGTDVLGMKYANRGAIVRLRSGVVVPSRRVRICLRYFEVNDTQSRFRTSCCL
ncbi:unnamed protein product, partial [Pylaiella littoralis]